MTLQYFHNISTSCAIFHTMHTSAVIMEGRRKKVRRYRMRETSEGENFRELVKNTILWRKCSRIAHLCRTKEHLTPKFCKKISMNRHKTAKFVKVFSLESFPQYGRQFAPLCNFPVLCFAILSSTLLFMKALDND